MPASWPVPVEILENHLRTVEALSALRARFFATPGAETSAPAASKSRFANMTAAEFESALREMAVELDRQTSFLLLASAEASLWTDYDRRIARRPKDPISERLRRLAKKAKASEQREVRFVDLLDAYRDGSPAASAKAAISRIKTLHKFRNWMAHGRHWVDLSGVRDPDPFEVWTDIQRLFDAIPGLDFLPAA